MMLLWIFATPIALTCGTCGYVKWSGEKYDHENFSEAHTKCGYMSARGFQNKWRDQRLPSLQCSGLHHKYSVRDRSSRGSRELCSQANDVYRGIFCACAPCQRKTKRIFANPWVQKTGIYFYYTSNFILHDKIPNSWFLFQRSLFLAKP